MKPKINTLFHHLLYKNDAVNYDAIVYDAVIDKDWLILKDEKLYVSKVSFRKRNWEEDKINFRQLIVDRNF